MKLSTFLKDHVTLLILGWMAASIICYLVLLRAPIEYIDITYIPFDVAIFISTIVIFMVFRFYGWDSFEGKVWFLFFVGALLWSIAEIMGFYVAFFDNEIISRGRDIPCILGYMFLIGACLYKTKYSKLYFDIKKIAVIAIAVVLFSSISIYLGVPPNLEDSGAIDTTGRTLDAPPDYYFTTVADNTTEGNYEVNVDTTEDISVNAVIVEDYGVDMDKKSVEEYYTVTDPEGNVVDGTITWDGQVMTFTPAAPLMANTTYYVSMLSGIGPQERITNVVYIILDILLLTLAMVIAVYWGREVSPGWYIIAASMIFMIIADVSYPIMEAANIYYDGNLMELIYIASYLCLGLGALYQKKFHEEFM